MLKRRQGVFWIACTLTACQEAPTSSNQQASHRPSKIASTRTDPRRTLTAVLQCSVGGTPVAVSACLAGSGDRTVTGQLKVRSGGGVRLYSGPDLYRPPFYQDRVTFSLEAPFEVNVQANSDLAAILRLEIRDGSRTVFRDEMSNLGGAFVTDETLGRATSVNGPEKRSTATPVNESDREAAIRDAERALREADEAYANAIYPD